MKRKHVKLVAMADAFRDRIDQCYKNVTADDLSDIAGVSGSVKKKVDVKEEHKFVGFDGYLKAIPFFEQAHALNPEDVQTMQQLMKLYAKTNDQEKYQQMKSKLGQ